MKTLILPLLLMLGAPLAAQSVQSTVALEGDIKLERTVSVDGKTQIELVAPEVVVPGDTLVFTTSYRNDGATAAENFAVSNAVPAEVMVSGDGVADLVVSVDGGKTWGPIATREVANPDGSFRPATAEDVTHIRWTAASIAAGSSGKFQYRAIVR